MADPTKSRCFCRPGYMCPDCEREGQRDAEYESEKRRVEKMRKGKGGGGDESDE